MDLTVGQSTLYRAPTTFIHSLLKQKWHDIKFATVAFCTIIYIYICICICVCACVCIARAFWPCVDNHNYLQEEVAKSMLAEFNLGCSRSDLDHQYRVYVATFLGFGGNSVRQAYEGYLVANASLTARNADNDRSADMASLYTINEFIVSLS